MSPEERKEYNRRWYRNNQEWVKAYNKRRAPRRREWHRKRYATNAEYRARVLRDRKKYTATGERKYARLKSQFGISKDDYLTLLAKQNGGCAICGRTESDVRGHKLAVDHCHKTKITRGLLCSNCNMGIGKFKDNIKLLEAAIMYMRSHQWET